MMADPRGVRCGAWSDNGRTSGHDFTLLPSPGQVSVIPSQCLPAYTFHTCILAFTHMLSVSVDVFLWQRLEYGPVAGRPVREFVLILEENSGISRGHILPTAILCSLSVFSSSEDMLALERRDQPIVLASLGMMPSPGIRPVVEISRQGFVGCWMSSCTESWSCLCDGMLDKLVTSGNRDCHSVIVLLSSYLAFIGKDGALEYKAGRVLGGSTDVHHFG
jgi:hypothetical protein